MNITRNKPTELGNTKKEEYHELVFKDASRSVLQCHETRYEKQYPDYEDYYYGISDAAQSRPYGGNLPDVCSRSYDDGWNEVIRTRELDKQRVLKDKKAKMREISTKNIKKELL